MSLKADKEGFLIGEGSAPDAESASYSRAMEIWKDIRGDTAAIRSALTGSIKEATRSKKTFAAIPSIKAANDSAMTGAAVTLTKVLRDNKGRFVAAPKTSVPSGNTSDGIALAKVAKQIVADRKKPIEPNQGRDSRGRFGSGGGSSGGNGKGSGNGDGAAALNSIKTGIDSIAESTSQAAHGVDPVLDASKELIDTGKAGIKVIKGGFNILGGLWKGAKGVYSGLKTAFTFGRSITSVLRGGGDQSLPIQKRILKELKLLNKKQENSSGSGAGGLLSGLLGGLGGLFSGGGFASILASIIPRVLPTLATMGGVLVRGLATLLPELLLVSAPLVLSYMLGKWLVSGPENKNSDSPRQGSYGYQSQKRARNPLFKQYDYANKFSGGAIDGLSLSESKAYAAATAGAESGGDQYADNGMGYRGLYQLGATALAGEGLVNMDKLKAYGSSLMIGKTSTEKRANFAKNFYAGGGQAKFLADPKNWNNGLSLEKYLGDKNLQDKTFVSYTNKNIKTLKNAKVAGMDTPDGVAKLAAQAHLVGATSVIQALKTGANAKDGNGTSATDRGVEVADTVRILSPQLPNAAMSLPRGISATSPNLVAIPQQGQPLKIPMEPQALNGASSKGTGSGNATVVIASEPGQNMNDRTLAHVASGGLGAQRK